MTVEDSVGPAATDGVEGWAAPALAGIQQVQLYPVPRVKVPPPSQRSKKGGGCRRARWEAREVNGAIDSMNWFAGHKTPCFGEPSEVQRGAQSRALSAVQGSVGSGIAHPTPAAAFSELLRGRSVYDMSAAGVNVAPYTTLDSLSLPDSLGEFVDLVKALPGEERHYVSAGL